MKTEIKKVKEKKGVNLEKEFTKEMINAFRRNGKHKIVFGVDFAYSNSWLDRLLIFFHLKKDKDYSCLVVGEKDKKGNITIIKLKYIK